MRFFADDIPEFTPRTEDSTHESLPTKRSVSRVPNEASGRPSSSRSEVRRFIKPLLETPAIRYDKVLRLKALVQSGKYETEEKISRTAEQLAKFLTMLK